MKITTLLFKDIDTKIIVWFQDNNQYIVVEKIVANILQLFSEKKSFTKIVDFLTKKINIPKKEGTLFIKDIEKLLNTSDKTVITKSKAVPLPTYFETKKYYKINDVTFLVEFSSEYEESLVHPKFAHLEIKSVQNTDYHYQVFSDDKAISFLIDGSEIGTWTLKEVHFFQGKFSMQLVQHIHQKEEKEWLGVFHASAISNGKNSMLFLGDSGNGKSTSLALLQANGFTCLADDFVPMDAKKQEIYSFPSAISIKRNSLETLLPIYPELQTSSEYHFKRLNKIVRYLPPNNTDYTRHLPCKALVFIKYKKDSILQIKKIDKLSAFEQLVPDSWLSPLKENAHTFLDWFANLPCYQLTYSDNQKMTTTVHKIFTDDL